MVYPSNFIFVQESRTPKMSAKEWLEERSLKYEALTEEVKPIMRGEEPWRFWECPNCGHRVYQAFFYCPFENCGVKLNWKE